VEGEQMAEPKTKRERKRAAAEARDADRGPGEGKAKRAQTKAERREARAGRKGRAAGAREAGRGPGRSDQIEARLVRIEDALARQAERSQELMAKLDEVLREARKSARHAKGAVERSAE
jgi:hypothetical protein